MTASTRERFYPATAEDQRLVRQELAEILQSPHFSNSKRYPALLTHVVQKTLSGQSEELKERILGIEVFHRPSDYDTNNDTVVRVAAGEVRKRLALIYHESAQDRPLQIALPTGSYVPEFYRSAAHEASESQQQSITDVAAAISASPAESLTPAPALAKTAKPSWIWYAAAATLFIALAASIFLRTELNHHQNAEDAFWQPLKNAGSSAIISPGALVSSSKTSYGMAIANSKDDYPFTSMATSIAMTRLVNLFSSEHLGYAVQPTSATTLDAMRQHPVILIGAYNNEWTPRLQADLRYQFTPDPARQIVDTTNPSTVWERPGSLPLREEDDYAVVARFHSKLTDNVVMLIAGIGKNGTEAASEFVTTPHDLQLLDQYDKDWASKNIEIILKTQVIDGKNSAPTIEAVYAW